MCPLLSCSYAFRPKKANIKLKQSVHTIRVRNSQIMCYVNKKKYTEIFTANSRISIQSYTHRIYSYLVCKYAHTFFVNFLVFCIYLQLSSLSFLKSMHNKNTHTPRTIHILRTFFIFLSSSSSSM